MARGCGVVGKQLKLWLVQPIISLYPCWASHLGDLLFKAELMRVRSIFVAVTWMVTSVGLLQPSIAQARTFDVTGITMGMSRAQAVA